MNWFFDKAFPWFFIGIFVFVVCVWVAIFGTGLYILMNADQIGDFILKLFGRN